MTGIEVSLVSARDLTAPLKLLEEAVRGGEPFPDEFVERLHGAVETGSLEVIAARAGGGTSGVAVVAYRPNFSIAADFASIEEMYVRPGERRRGVGRALLEAIGERCAARGVSYVEVQTDEEAEPFYVALDYEAEFGVRVMSRMHAL